MAELQATELPTKASPSLQYNNLTTAGGKLAYVHRGEAYLADLASPVCTSLQIKNVTQVQGVGAQLLVLTKDEVVIVNAADEKTAATIKLPVTDNFLTRGVGVSGDLVLIGHSNGSITQISLKGASVVGTVQEHGEAITAIRGGQLGSEAVFVSADMGGDVVVWTADGKVKTKLPKAEGDTPTSVAVGNNLVLVAYGSGKIRAFNAEGKKKIEIDAHGRWINGITFDQGSSTLASVGEDQLLQLWAFAGEKVSYKGYKLFANCLLTGVEAVDGKVYAAAYDVEKIFTVPL
jgi:hypothetical protein